MRANCGPPRQTGAAISGVFAVGEAAVAVAAPPDQPRSAQPVRHHLVVWSFRGRVRWVLTAVVVASAVTRFAVARGVDAPWIAPDETIYALLGRSLWSSARLSLLGGDTSFYSLVYPALIGLPLSLFGPAAGLVAVQAVQAVVMSAVAIIVFAWGRPVVGAPWALAAAVLSVLIPGLSYAGLLMSETVFYLVIALALWALWAVLARPSPHRQVLLLAAMGLAFLTRVQAVGLIPAVFVAIALFCIFTRDVTILRRLTPTLVVLALAIALAAAVSALGGGWSELVGAYGAATGGYEAGEAAKDIVWHLGGVFLVVAGVPLLALALLAVRCARTRESDAAAALVATAFAWTLITVVEVGVFASRWVGHMAERLLITVAPPLFLVLVLWLARGAPRPQPATSVVALLVAAPALLLPVARFANQAAALDAFTFIPLWQLREATSSDTLQLAYALSVAAVVAVTVLVPRRARVTLAALVAAVLASTSALSAREIDRLTRADRAWVFGTTDPRWIDEAAAGPVTYLHAHTAFTAALWKTLYWNERIDKVLAFYGTPAPGPLVQQLIAPAAEGIVVDASGARPRSGHVVAPAGIVLAGERLASYGPAMDIPGLTLWQADMPLRVRWIASGIQWNGDIQGSARIEILGCGPGQLELTLLGKEGAPVEISANGRSILTVSPAPDTVWVGAVPSPATADARSSCIYEIRSRLVGSTRIEFVPGEREARG